MKLTGNYTLFMDKKLGQASGDTYEITAIDIKKERADSQGGKPLFWYTIKTTSVHGSYYNKHIGMVIGFTLRNNITGEKTRYQIGKRPHTVV